MNNRTAVLGAIGAVIALVLMLNWVFGPTEITERAPETTESQPPQRTSTNKNRVAVSAPDTRFTVEIGIGEDKKSVDLVGKGVAEDSPRWVVNLGENVFSWTPKVFQRDTFVLIYQADWSGEHMAQRHQFILRINNRDGSISGRVELPDDIYFTEFLRYSGSIYVVGGTGDDTASSIVVVEHSLSIGNERRRFTVKMPPDITTQGRQKLVMESDGRLRVLGVLLRQFGLGPIYEPLDLTIDRSLGSYKFNLDP